MDEVLKKMAELDQKVDAVYNSVEKTRKYFMWTLILSIVFLVLPFIALLFVIPQLLSSIGGYSDLLR